MKSGLTLLEATLYALALSISLTVALAYSALWDAVPDLGSLLPSRYVDLLALLVVETNTALAFLLILALTTGSLLILRHPVIGLSLVTGAVLATAAYPYGALRWHRVFFQLPFDEGQPSIGLWIRATLPVLLLLVIPIVLQIRNLVTRYGEKHVERSELLAVRTHLVGMAVQNTLIALAFTAGLGVLLFGTRALFAGGGQNLVEHNILIMLVVAFLLVAAIGIGTGVFQKQAPTDEDDEDAGWQRVDA